jgi:hypothetical protein
MAARAHCAIFLVHFCGNQPVLRRESNRSVTQGVAWTYVVCTRNASPCGMVHMTREDAWFQARLSLQLAYRMPGSSTSAHFTGQDVTKTLACSRREHLLKPLSGWAGQEDTGTCAH